MIPAFAGRNPEASNDIDLLVSSIETGYHITRSLEADITFAYTYGFEKEYESRTYDLDSLTLLAGIRYRR